MTTTTTNEDTVKAAATKMCAELATKGVKVKHSLMLEVLAKSFGLNDWRTLKAVIDAPRAEPKPVVPPLGTMQTWSLESIYLENNQQYGDDCYGRTALEAAIDGIMERLTDFGLELGIVSVSNADESVVLSPSFITEIQLLTNRLALETLLSEVTRCVPLSGALKTYCNWLQAVLGAYDEKDSLSELTDYSEMDGQSWAKPGNIGHISEALAIQPTVALLALCERVEQSFRSLMSMEESNKTLAVAIYQVRAMTSHFESNCNHKAVSILLDMEFEVVAD